MPDEEKDKRQGGDRRSIGCRRTKEGDRRVEQDPAWLGERNRRKGPACRRVGDDRRKGIDRRNKE